ncbi:unnamed protein product, partial [Rotaria sp. Silwood2]
EVYGTYRNRDIYPALDKYASLAIINKECAVIGSESPWIEAALLEYNASSVTTIEYATIHSNIPRLFTITPMDFAKQQQNSKGQRQLFDSVWSYSSIEHDGLGRYRDPLNPYGDFQTMVKITCILKPGGFLFLSVPLNVQDLIQFNLHRLYGPIRLPLLYRNFHIVEMLGSAMQRKRGSFGAQQNKIRQELIERLENQAVTICPNLWSDPYRQISYLGISICFTNEKFQYLTYDLCCCPFVEDDKSAPNIIVPFGISDLTKFNGVSDRDSNFLKILKAYSTTNCVAHRLNNVLKGCFYQTNKKKLESVKAAPEEILEITSPSDSEKDSGDYEDDNKAEDNGQGKGDKGVTIVILTLRETLRTHKSLIDYSKNYRITSSAESISRNEEEYIEEDEGNSC